MHVRFLHLDICVVVIDDAFGRRSDALRSAKYNVAPPPSAQLDPAQTDLTLNTVDDFGINSTEKVCVKDQKATILDCSARQAS